MSPYELLQEIYHSDPWKSQVCCILLNCTRRVQVDRVRDELFRRYPDAVEMSTADPSELSQLLKPLGFYNRRAKTLIKFSFDWIDKDWQHPKELYGIGQYAADSWDIFYENRLDIEPNDGVLVKYLQWKRNQVNHSMPILAN
jgi:methyl-CpG-binding domain protein 4